MRPLPPPPTWRAGAPGSRRLGRRSTRRGSRRRRRSSSPPSGSRSAASRCWRRRGRMARAYTELLTVPEFDLTTFPNDEEYDELVLVENIPVHSLCEHHMLPFVGVAHVGYLPGQRIVGLSKFARLVEFHARRRADPGAADPADRATTSAVSSSRAASGWSIEAEHSCMSLRGARVPAARTVTSALLGRLRDDPASRAEFLSLARPAREVDEHRRRGRRAGRGQRRRGAARRRGTTATSPCSAPSRTRRTTDRRSRRRSCSARRSRSPRSCTTPGGTPSSDVDLRLGEEVLALDLAAAAWLTTAGGDARLRAAAARHRRRTAPARRRGRQRGAASPTCAPSTTAARCAPRWSTGGRVMIVGGRLDRAGGGRGRRGGRVRRSPWSRPRRCRCSGCSGPGRARSSPTCTARTASTSGSTPRSATSRRRRTSGVRLTLGRRLGRRGRPARRRRRRRAAASASPSAPG